MFSCTVAPYTYDRGASYIRSATLVSTNVSTQVAGDEASTTILRDGCLWFVVPGLL